MVKIAVVSTWRPYWDGVALYSEKLNREVAKVAQIEVIANKIDGCKPRENVSPHIYLQRTWSRENPFCILQILHALLKSHANIFHLHHGWLLYGNHVTVLLFPLLVLLLRLKNTPVVVTMHTVIRRDAKLFKKSLYNIIFRILIFSITRLIVLFSSMVVVHNRMMQSILIESYGLEEDKIHIIPHGVERALKANPKEAIRPTDPQEEETSILSFGFLREDKGFELLIKTFERIRRVHKNLRLVLIASPHPHDDGWYAQKIHNCIAQLKTQSNLVFNQFVPENVLDQIIYETDIIVLLSQNRNFIESSGALARIADFEKPVICNRVAKFQSELTDGVDCLMAKPGDLKGLSNAVDILLRDDSLRKRIAKNLKIRFRYRYWKDVMEQHLKLYNDLLSRNH